MVFNEAQSFARFSGVSATVCCWGCELLLLFCEDDDDVLDAGLLLLPEVSAGALLPVLTLTWLYFVPVAGGVSE